MKNSLLKKFLATALSVVMALGSSIYAFAADTEATPSLTVSKADVSVAIDKTIYITVTAANGTEGTSVVAKSENDQIATATLDGTKLTFAGVNAGVVDVKVTYGKLSETVTVTVPASTATPAAVKFYSDSALSKAITSVTDIWAGGGKIKNSDGTVTAYNTTTLYTNASATVIDPNVTDNKVVKKAGKVYVAVSKSDVTDVTKVYDTSKKKVVTDAEAAACLKATYTAVKNMNGGSLTLTAGKNTGKVKVWVIDVNANNEIVRSAAIPVTVKGAASKMILTIDDSAETIVPLKNVSVCYGGSVSGLSLVGYLADGKTTTSDATYTVVSANEDLVKGTLTTSSGKTTLKLESTKKNIIGKTNVTITCNESGKKLVIPVTITNPVVSIDKKIGKLSEDDDQKLWLKGDKIVINITENVPLEDLATTDKVKIYVADETAKDSELKISADGKKVEYTPSKAISATYKNGVITITRVDPFTEAVVYLVYTDSASKELNPIKVGEIAAISISGGGFTAAK